MPRAALAPELSPDVPTAREAMLAAFASGKRAAGLELQYALALARERANKATPPAAPVAFRRYVETFAPGDLAAYSGLVYLWFGGNDWTRRETADPRAAIEAHLAAANSKEWQSLADEPAPVLAVGLAFPAEARVAYLNVDLDGGIEPRRFLSAFRSIGACALVTSGSGQPGRYRALYRLARPLPVGELRTLTRALCRGLKLRPKQGAIEIYPATKNGRLPFGLGGCTRFDAIDPRPDKRSESTPEALYRAFRRLPAFDIERAANEHGRPEPEPEPAPPGVSRHREKRRLATRASTPAHVTDWLAHGVNPNERLDAIRAIVQDAWFRGLPPDDAIACLNEWIANGGIARSNYAKRRKHKAIALAIADTPRHVERLYRLFACFVPLGAKETHLSADELRALVPIVQAAAARARVSTTRAGSFALAMLPWFKGAKGEPVKIHVDRWKAAAGGAGDYRRIRDAFGLWCKASGYLAQRNATKGEKAFSTSYTCSFPFAELAPRRALARSWKRALAITARQTAQETR